ncbi:MAG TPA: KTSC domain-containing protein [Candidatus Thermoplasmatota archaeon]|nr:KTSC domain-containing protein [Candidatus Thermoplasmatota archaeon]
MRRKRVASSSLRSVGYDPDGQVLEVEFAGGHVYRYWQVPPQRHRGLLRAASKGRYFNRWIRERYPTVQVA